LHTLSAHDNTYCVFDCVSIASSQTPLVAPHEESVPTGSFVVIERSDLHIGDKLGGEVYKCKWKSRSLIVAVKRLSGELQEGEVQLIAKASQQGIDCAKPQLDN